MSLKTSETDRIFAPITECVFIISYSSSVSLEVFERTSSGIPIFPISWNKPPIRKIRSCSSDKFSFSPIKTAYLDTLSECPLV